MQELEINENEICEILDFTVPEEPENPWDPVLVVEEDTEPPSIRVYYVAIDEDSLAKGLTWDLAKKDKVLIIEIFNSYVVTYPIHVRRDKPDYLQPKYGKIKSLTLDWFDHGWVEEPEAVKEMLECFPEGFSKQFQYGLGLKWEYRFLIQNIARIEGIEHIVFTKDKISKAEEDIYFFNMRDYQTLRRATDSITRRYQREGHEDKQLLCYTNILRKHDPQKYPLLTKKPKAGTIYELATSISSKVKLTKKDEESMIRLVQGNKEALAKHHRSSLLQLKSDIEYVTIGQIVSNLEDMLAKNLSESHWQSFFKANSFVLTLAFSYPVTLVQDQAHVGGADIRGIGAKITDFLVANRFTGNLAVFEIKKPDSELLSTVEYRSNLFRHSKELSGAIAQAQDQRFQLQNNFANLAYQSGWNDYHAFCVQCIVIIGRSLTDSHQKKSFEFIRNGLRDVHIITYDEVLAKIKQLHELFVSGKAKEGETAPEQEQLHV